MEPTPAILVVALTAAAAAAVNLWLSARIGMLRGKLKIMVGDGGHPWMIRAMRGQSNFTENVPLALVLFLVMALIGTPAWVLALFGVTLIVARVLHGMHFLAEDAPGWQRMAGAGLTLLVQALAMLGLAAHAVFLMVAA
ncbi:glutathione S-transferase [Halovulum dunhuangense]|uniref:Glutathione S-transferase n=1 Tax=Halovulum dunhuangense TaxID=1505036 RepID=A0A849L034_9RHOB|nr:MAPEG family protein [Halovulum dunhuangense]NNU79020.1 glutathione S-transferase [Halovulum dunhuangense]